MTRIRMFAGATLIAGALCATTASAQETVRLGYAVQVHQANMMILEEAAQEHGVELEMTPMRRYADLQLAFTTGQIDMVVLGYPNLGLMHDSDFTDYKAVAGVFNGAQSLTLSPDVEAEEWSDIEGLRIGSPPNSTAELLFKASMAANGADWTKVNLVSFTTAGPPMLSSLESGELDGFIAWEPNNAEAQVGGYGVYSELDIADNPTNGINGVLLARTDFIESNPDAVQGVVTALVEVTDLLNEDRERYVEVAVAGTGSSAEVVELAIPRGSLDYRLPLNETKEMMKIIADAGITQQNWAEEIEPQFDYSFLEQATGKARAELGG